MKIRQKLKLEIYRDGKKHYIEFNNGKAKSPLKVIGKTKDTGTQINFLDDEVIGKIPLFATDENGYKNLIQRNTSN